MPKEKLTVSEKRILRELIYPESFDHIITETNYTYGEIRNDLIQMINHGLIEVYQHSDRTSGLYFDSDQVELFSFKATKSGLKKIQHEAI